MTRSDAWIQSEHRTPALIFDDGAVVPAERETERQQMVTRISPVTSNVRRATQGACVSTYMVENGDRMYAVVLKATRPAAADAQGRRVVSSLVVCSVTASDADQQLKALRQKVLDRGIALAPLPEDIESPHAGLIASGRQGCLPIGAEHQFLREL